MRRLRRRRGADTQISETRRKGRWMRWLYIAALFGFILWLGDLFLGQYVYLDAAGMVLAQKNTIAVEYIGTVVEWNAPEGRELPANFRVGTVTSQDIERRLETYEAEMAERRAKLANSAERNRALEKQIAAAETHAATAEEVRRDFETLRAKGLLPANKRLQAEDADYRAKAEVRTLESDRELNDLDRTADLKALVELHRALLDLRKIYNDGDLVTPTAAMTGTVYVVQGGVVRPGEPLVDLYSPPYFVQAYIPTAALYDTKIGDEVIVQSGLRTSRGCIEHVEGIASALPREFQKTFTPIERSWVIDISVWKYGLPPLFTKVAVKSAHWPPEWLFRLFDELGVPLAQFIENRGWSDLFPALTQGVDPRCPLVGIPPRSGPPNPR